MTTPHLLRLLLPTCCLFGLMAATGTGQDDAPPRKWPALEFRKWSGAINVPDPVALSVDNQGRVFVTQTRRRKIQDLDIRQHSQWIPNDLGLRSVEDKRAFFRQAMAIGGDQAAQKKHVQDWNQDGQHDWRDLTVVSEAIYRLVDQDADGTADQITVFAEDFKTEVTGVAAGVLAFRGDVYATVAPDVWRLRDHDNDGIADSREVVAHGFGLHIAYGGHDMHGLTVGPDGKLYWSIGDKGISVTTPEGREYFYPDEGGVLRCNPDGSDFEVFAHGLRNVQEVQFDQYGNMFGVDNDADQPNERERFVFIVDQMDAGWRCFHQYRGDAYNPWTAERLWDLPGENHPAYLVPPISHYIDGPAGFKFNPGTALCPEYKDFFFLTGAPNGNQHAFRVEPAGDSFLMVDEHQFGQGTPIVGLAFGPDGALYGADWDGGYPLDEKGAVIRIDVPEPQSEERRDVAKLLLEGFDARSPKDLVKLLHHADQRVRMGAQFGLVRVNAADQLAAVAVDEDSGELARLHSTWGLGQLARQGDNLARDTLGMLMLAGNPRVRGQAAKTYGELKSVDPQPLLKLLTDGDLHVRMLACLAVARQPTAKAVATLLDQASALTKDLHTLRHGIVTALAACATAEQLAAESKHENELRRLCCVLALRRQANARVADFLPDESDWVADAAARAINDDASIPEALPKLAEALSSRHASSEAFFRRAVNANYRIGDRQAAARLVQYVSQADVPAARQAHVAETLAEWLKPDVLDRVQGIYRPLDPARREIDASQLAPLVSRWLRSQSEAIRNAAFALSKNLQVSISLDTLQQMVEDKTLDEGTRLRALNAFYQQAQEVLTQAKQSDSDAVRVRALDLSAAGQPAAAVEELRAVLESTASVEAKQGVLDLLARSKGAEAVELAEQMAQRLVDGRLDKALGLEMLDVMDAHASASPELRKLSSVLREQLAQEDRQSLAFALARDGGSVSDGERLFRTHVQAQCARCHRIGPEGSEIGPPLIEIAKTRDADYLLRAIVSPSADIDAKYRSQSFLLESDEIVRGVVQSEADGNTIIADSTGKLITVATDEILQRKEQKISLMPEMKEVLSPREVRDLVAYLRSLK